MVFCKRKARQIEKDNLLRHDEFVIGILVLRHDKVRFRASQIALTNANVSSFSRKNFETTARMATITVPEPIP